MAQRLSFASAEFSPELSVRQRYNSWRDGYAARFGPCEFSISHDQPFQAGIKVMSLGAVSVAEVSGTINQVRRTRQNIADDGSAARRLYINAGATPIGGMHLGREFVAKTGDAFLTSGCEPLSVSGLERNAWLSIRLPEDVSSEAFRNADDRSSLSIDSGNQALIMLRRYIGFLGDGAPLASAALLGHATDTIVDLVGLAAGLGRDEEQLGASGLRAVRLAAIGDKIARGFEDPSISVHSVARQLGLSPRYVYDLLQQSGRGFTERILELRLQRARSMLGELRYGHMRIGEIALSCGFGDISYFNRCFRRRFGCTPRSAR